MFVYCRCNNGESRQTTRIRINQHNVVPSRDNQLATILIIFCHRGKTNDANYFIHSCLLLVCLFLLHIFIIIMIIIMRRICDHSLSNDRAITSKLHQSCQPIEKEMTKPASYNTLAVSQNFHQEIINQLSLNQRHSKLTIN